MTYSAVYKRLKKIHEIIGPLFILDKRQVAAYPHTLEVVKIYREAVRLADKAASVAFELEDVRRRARVNVAIVDHLEPFIAGNLIKALEETNIQICFSHTAPYILNERFQSSFLMSQLLEAGDIDILVCFELAHLGVASEKTTPTTNSKSQSRILYTDSSLCLVNKDVECGDQLTLEEFQAFKRVVQIPEYALQGSDIPFIVTSGTTAAELIKADNSVICVPSSLIANYLAESFDLKTVLPPDEEQNRVRIKMVWENSTTEQEECAIVRSAIMRFFAQLSK